MLRPATPLSILFFVAFVLLLLSTLSTPLIKSIPLATYRGVHFGVLGYCENGDQGCKGPMIGYNTGMALYIPYICDQDANSWIQRSYLQAKTAPTSPSHPPSAMRFLPSSSCTPSQLS